MPAGSFHADGSWRRNSVSAMDEPIRFGPPLLSKGCLRTWLTNPFGSCSALAESAAGEGKAHEQSIPPGEGDLFWSGDPPPFTSIHFFDEVVWEVRPARLGAPRLSAAANSVLLRDKRPMRMFRIICPFSDNEYLMKVLTPRRGGVSLCPSAPRQVQRETGGHHASGGTAKGGVEPRRERWGRERVGRGDGPGGTLRTLLSASSEAGECHAPQA
jgi:hypothetical protein